MSVRDHAAVEAAKVVADKPGVGLSRSHLAAYGSCSSGRAHALAPGANWARRAGRSQVAVLTNPRSVGFVLEQSLASNTRAPGRAGSLCFELGLLSIAGRTGKSCSCWATARCSSSCTCFRLAVHDSDAKETGLPPHRGMFRQSYWPERP